MKLANIFEVWKSSLKFKVVWASAAFINNNGSLLKILFVCFGVCVLWVSHRNLSPLVHGSHLFFSWRYWIICLCLVTRVSYLLTKYHCINSGLSALHLGPCVYVWHNKLTRKGPVRIWTILTCIPVTILAFLIPRLTGGEMPVQKILDSKVNKGELALLSHRYKSS